MAGSGGKMDVKIKGKNLVITHKLQKDETYKVQTGKFNSVSIYKKPQIANGISSYCGDGKHCLFIDYDDVPLWLVKEDYSRLQDEFSLPQAYLFHTQLNKENDELYGNFHIICLVKFYPKQIYDILSKTHADINFMSMPLRRRWRNWTLRISAKKNKDRPTYYGLIGRKVESELLCSNAHLNFLKKIYPLEEVKYNLDNNDKIFLQKYETS